MSMPIRYLLPILLTLVSTSPAKGRVEQAAEAPDRRVTEAVKLWEGGDQEARLGALRRLERLGPRAAPAVGALIRGLTDRDPKIRTETANVLRRIGSAANPAVPILTAMLKDPERDVRSAAAWALGSSRPDPKSVIPALVASVRAEPDRRCLAAVRTLGAIGEPAVPSLIDLLKEKDPKIRWMTVSALDQIGSGAKTAVPALIEALHEPDREVRYQIAEAIAKVGPDAVDRLIVALRDRDPKVRGGSARALALLGERAKAAVPALIAALADPEPPEDPKPPRGPSSDGWGREGKPGASGYHAALEAMGTTAVTALLEQLDRPDRRSKLLALRALGFVDDNGHKAVPRLIPLLDDPDLRLDAASALGGMGPAARPAIPRLRDGLKDRDPAFRARAAETIGRIGWELQMANLGTETTVARGAVPSLAAALKDPEVQVRVAAARALRDIGSESCVVIPDLLAVLGDPVAEVRLAAIRAFRRVGDVPPGSRPVLITLFKDSDSRVRTAAVRAVDEESLETSAVIVGLLASLKDPVADVRAAAAAKLDRAHVIGSSNPVVRNAGSEASSEFAPTAKECVRALLAALNDRDGTYSNDYLSVAKAANALKAFDPVAKAAMIDKITAGLGDPDESVRRRVSWALQMLGGRSSRPLFRLLSDPHTPQPVKAGVLRVLAGADGAGVDSSLEIPQPLGSDARAAIPVLRAMAREGQPEIVRSTLKLLSTLEARDDETVRWFLETLRRASNHAMKIEGQRAFLEPTMIPFLLKELNDPDPEVRAELVRAIFVLARKLPFEREKQDFREEEREELTENEKADRALGLRLKAQAAHAFSPLLKDSDPSVRWNAATALGVFRAEAKTVVPLLIQMVKTDAGRLPSDADVWDPDSVQSKYYGAGYYGWGRTTKEGIGSGSPRSRRWGRSASRPERRCLSSSGSSVTTQTRGRDGSQR